jgi:hypothetical protein
MNSNPYLQEEEVKENAPPPVEQSIALNYVNTQLSRFIGSYFAPNRSEEQ